MGVVGVGDIWLGNGGGAGGRVALIGSSGGFQCSKRLMCGRTGGWVAVEGCAVADVVGVV